MGLMVMLLTMMVMVMTAMMMVRDIVVGGAAGGGRGGDDECGIDSVRVHPLLVMLKVMTIFVKKTTQKPFAPKCP